jgi:outer membrane beta-barrel protein
MNRLLRAASALALLALAAAAQAAEPERVVVRNRQFATDGHFEGTVAAGTTIVNYLTDHTNLTGSLAYNLTEQFAFELSGGYALSRHTNVAEAAATEVVTADPTTQQKRVDDFSDLWQLGWSATGALRWAPIYGKLNIAAELPVHFQFYLLAGGGAGGMTRDSLVYCIGNVDPTKRKSATCNPGDPNPYNLAPLHSSAVKPLILGGVGMRFFLTKWAGLRLEVRDLAFPDSYRVGITRADSEHDTGALNGGEAAATQGRQADSPGFTHLVFVQLGASFLF